MRGVNSSRTFSNLFVYNSQPQDGATESLYLSTDLELQCVLSFRAKQDVHLLYSDKETHAKRSECLYLYEYVYTYHFFAMACTLWHLLGWLDGLSIGPLYWHCAGWKDRAWAKTGWREATVTLQSQCPGLSPPQWRWGTAYIIFWEERDCMRDMKLA